MIQEKGKMKATHIKSKAKWSLQEIIPVVITLGLGLLGVYFGVTEYFTLAGSIITSVIGFGLAGLIFKISFGRKSRSTLYAVLANDKNLNVDIWMKKPVKDKWLGKLDKGNNSGALSGINHIKIETIRGTRVMTLRTLKGKPIYVPMRLAEVREFREYLAKAVEMRGKKLSFETKANGEEFAALLTNNAYIIPEKELEAYADPKDKTKKIMLEEDDKSAKLKPTVVASEPENEPLKPVGKKIGYGAYSKGKGMPKTIIPETKEDDEVKATSASDDLVGGLFNENNSSISIDFGSSDEK